MKKIWFTEQNQITGFSALTFDKHVLRWRNHHREPKFANWKNHSTLQDDFPPPYYSFHETPGDIVHTLLTAFTPLLFPCYPSLPPSVPGGNAQKRSICKGCHCWLADSSGKARRAFSCLAVCLLRVSSTGHWASLTHQAVPRYLTPGCCTAWGTDRLLTALSCF